MKTLALATATALLTVATAHAADWTINQTQSRIGFSDTQTGQTFSGQFTNYTAQISFDPASPAVGHALIAIQTGSAKTGDTQRDEALPGADWFNVSAFPTATFKTTSFKSLGGNKYEADGTLTIRNITKPLTLPFTFTPNGKAATVDGQIVLKRTDYGVGQGSWSTGDWVGLNVTVTIHLAATQK